MSKLITRDGKPGLFILALTTDGALDVDAMCADLREQATKINTDATADFDTVASEVNAWLLENPGLRNCPIGEFIRSVQERRIEAGYYKHADGKPWTREEKNAALDRLAEVLPNYLRSAKDRFHVGKKMGVVIRFVEGEVKKDEEGNPVFNQKGEEIPHRRHTDEEWAKLTAPKAKDVPAPAGSSPAVAAS